MSREHARALRIIQDHGADEKRAHSILHALGQAGIHLVMTEPPTEPNTGDKAEARTRSQAYAEAKAAIAEARKKTTTIATAEENES